MARLAALASIVVNGDGRLPLPELAPASPVRRVNRMMPSRLHAPPPIVAPIAQGDGRPSRGVDLLELPVRDERQPSAVGRPERRIGAVGAGQRPRHEAVERPNHNWLAGRLRWPRTPRRPSGESDGGTVLGRCSRAGARNRAAITRGSAAGLERRCGESTASAEGDAPEQPPAVRASASGAACRARPPQPASSARARSSISSRASPMSRRRVVGSFSRQRRSSRRIAGGVRAAARSSRAPLAGSPPACPPRPRPRTRAVPVSISKSTQPNAQMSAALVDRPALAPARGSCRPRCPGSSRPRHRRAGDRRRLRRVDAERDRGSSALARPKSRTFTVPSGRSLMFAGFRSRWTMPCSCAASSASAICRAIGSASSSGIGPCGDPLRERRPLDQLQHQRADAVRLFEAVDRRDVRMIQRREHLRLALEAGEAIGIVRERARAGP